MCDLIKIILLNMAKNRAKKVWKYKKNICNKYITLFEMSDKDREVKQDKWVGVRIPLGLALEIDALIERMPRWSSRSDFVKDAIRQLLNYYYELENKMEK
jgi:hypothetical protein